MDIYLYQKKIAPKIIASDINQNALNNAKENIYGAKIMNQAIIVNMCMLFPPLSEQQQIADYLDEKTAEIKASNLKIANGEKYYDPKE